MAADQFLCSVCLDVFTDPVTVPCGHNYCRSCITKQRSFSTQQQRPMCKELFDTRPDLKINTFVSEVAANSRSSAQRKARSFSQRTFAIPDQVLCDVCTESKKKAVKSCLECLTSYCETHLEPHQKLTGLRRHKLIGPVDNLEDRVCRRHEKPLEMFCRMDQVCVCQSCAVSDHKKHKIISLIKGYKEKKKDLEKTEAQVQHLIKERLLKMEQIKQSVKLSKEDAEEVKAAIVQRCATLIKSTRKSLDQFLELVEQKQRTTEEQAEGLIKELEEEIVELKSSELNQLSQTEDHFQLLQNLTSLKINAKDWTKVQLPSSCDGTVRKAAAELETLGKQMKKLYADMELLRAQLYTVDMTLDRDTANPYLILSDDGKRVGCGDVEQDLPDKPERLSSFGVLGDQSFSSGKFYYEVQVEGKTKWELGVVRVSISRKGENTICPENGYWALWLRNGHYRALTGPSVPLFLKSRPLKVGVFVDYDEGMVCFYDTDTALLIYSFTNCKFTEKLYPYFSPCSSDGGKNSTPLIISTIR